MRRFVIVTIDARELGSLSEIPADRTQLIQ
jgi:hypothetical protein